jgi:hypothetical protein
MTSVHYKREGPLSEAKMAAMILDDSQIQVDVCGALLLDTEPLIGTDKHCSFDSKRGTGGMLHFDHALGLLIT